MNSLYLINETFTNGYRLEVLDLFSFFSIISGIFVIISKNPIISVLFLIALFLSIASYLILLGISFIALSYLLVYVGAVSILFLFILMLINVRISELLNQTSHSVPLALIIAISFNYPLYQILPYKLTVFNTYSPDLNNIFKSVLQGNNYIHYLDKFSIYSKHNAEISFVSSKI